MSSEDSGVPETLIEINPGRVRPSNSHIWAGGCTIQPKLCEVRNLNGVSGPWADEGALAHYVWQISHQPFLEGIAFPKGISLTEKDITQEMSDYAVKCNDYVRKFIDYEQFRWTSETIVPRFYQPNQTCMVDFFGWVLLEDGTYHLQVFDLKYGKFKTVYAKNNKQQLCYAGSLHTWLLRNGHLPKNAVVSKITLHILQVRQDRFDSWEITAADLSNECAAIKLAFDKAYVLQENLEFHASEETCNHFCPAKNCCPARFKEMKNALPETLQPQEKQKLNVWGEIPAEMIEFYYGKISIIKKFVEFLEAEMAIRCDDGTSEQYVWENTLGRRKWKDEAAQQAVLTKVSRALKMKKQDLCPPTILSPAKMLQLVKDNKGSQKIKNIVDSCIVQPPGKKIVLKSKSKDPWQEDDFEGLLENHPQPITKRK